MKCLLTGACRAGGLAARLLGKSAPSFLAGGLRSAEPPGPWGQGGRSGVGGGALEFQQLTLAPGGEEAALSWGPSCF